MSEHKWTKPEPMGSPVCFVPGTDKFYEFKNKKWTWEWCQNCDLQRWTPLEEGTVIYLGKRQDGLVPEPIPCPGPGISVWSL
jgi:hypothetical protein